MPRTVTLRLDEATYDLFRAFALADNRPLSNLIETAARRHLEDCRFVDDSEMRGILKDRDLVFRLRRGSAAARARRGRFAR